jgi:hypothetical protein
MRTDMKPPRDSGLTRRRLLFSASALGLTLLLPRRGRTAAPSKPRFLLHLQAQGGLDTTMMFDARPLAMTAAGKIHNPLGVEPTAWVGSNGTTAWTHQTAAALHPLQDRFSVINGVVMSTSFDGHDQNTNLFLAGNPFGGTSFNAEINAGAVAPLDYIRIGDLFATLEDSRVVQLTAPGLKQLVGGASSLSVLSPALEEFLGSEAALLGKRTDRFGAGVNNLAAANLSSTELQSKVTSIVLEDTEDPLDGQLAVIREVFRRGIARGAVFSIVDPGESFDNHAAASAQNQGPSFEALCARIARVFSYLAETPFDDTSSLLDVTTVVVGSEFGRTMRQQDQPIDDTGTDHNPLSNTVLIGGAGIKSGLVLGASDFQLADEVLSGAHLALDPDAVKVMGRPFDFATGLPRTDAPAAFAPADYLQIASVVNTVYALFDVPKDRWRLQERAGALAPVLQQLIA